MNDRDNTCATMSTTLCVSTMGVYIVRTTHAQKYKPSISPKQGRRHDITIKMPNMTVGQTSEKEPRHV